MIDRKKIEEAIACYACCAGDGSHLHALLEAAKTLLETLPKPMWTVRVWEGSILLEHSPWPSREEALHAAACLLERGCRKVEIEPPPTDTSA